MGPHHNSQGPPIPANIAMFWVDIAGHITMRVHGLVREEPSVLSHSPELFRPTGLLSNRGTSGIQDAASMDVDDLSYNVWSSECQRQPRKESLGLAVST
jgi:hypothetical protein